jgi:hypothetical protein
MRPDTDFVGRTKNRPEGGSTERQYPSALTLPETRSAFAYAEMRFLKAWVAFARIFKSMNSARMLKCSFEAWVAFARIFKSMNPARMLNCSSVARIAFARIFKSINHALLSGKADRQPGLISMHNSLRGCGSTALRL